MKKLLFLSVLIGFLACDDGDLQIEEVDFDEATIQSCSEIAEPTETTFFFKIDADEALLLNLEEGLITNRTSQPGVLNSTIPTPSQLIYRLFSDNVAQAYFCDAVPPLEPMVINENNATAGDISIETRVDTLTTTTKNYAHTITINNVSLVNDQGEELTDLTPLEYGRFITQEANSTRSEEGPFSNYSELEARRCAPAPIDSTIRLQTQINDEFIALDVPENTDLFDNMITPDTIPRELDLENGEVIKYVVLDTLVTTELACTDAFGEDITDWRFVSTAGTLFVETTVGEPDADGAVEYTHTITVEDLVLTSKGTTSNGNDVDLTPIPSAAIGFYVTTVE